jgi:hypothetical protein
MPAKMGPWGKSEKGARPDRLFWVEGWTQCSAAAEGLVVVRLLPVGDLKRPGPFDDRQTLRASAVLAALIEASFERLPRGRPPKCFACKRYILDERRPLAAALALQPYREDEDTLFAYGVCADCVAVAGGERAAFEELVGRMRVVIGARNLTGRFVDALGNG